MYFQLNNQILCLFAICALFIQASDANKPRLLRLPVEKRASQGSTPKAFSKRDTALLYNDGSEYIVKVSIGTPPQNFTVSLDTGSADLWVPSIYCEKEECNLSRFDPNKSSSFVDTSYPFQINYGLGHAHGYYGQDTVRIGDAVVPSQQFGLASSTKDIITGESVNKHPDGLRVLPNGILGLGYPGLTSASGSEIGKYEPFVFNLARQGLIDEPVFSVFMSHVERTGWTGELLLGGVDHGRHKGDMIYVPVSYMDTKKTRPEDLLKYWMVTGQSFGLLEDGDLVLDYSLGKPRNVIIDTGTTMTYVDATLAEMLVETAVGKDNWSFDADIEMYRVTCSSYTLNKTLEMRLSQKAMKFTDTPVVISVPLKALIIPLGGRTIQRASQCVFGIAPWIPETDSSGLSNAEMILVGDSILRSTYLAFDMAKNQIGFSQAVGTSGSVTGPVLDATLDKGSFGDQSFASYTSGASKRSRATEFVTILIIVFSVIVNTAHFYH
ncbi:aspartic peptidase domain-containing protein [Phycomyces nitens]|nr:aspartic peptidase domain-containing protein [Phycomyces nitens]